MDPMDWASWQRGTEAPGALSGWPASDVLPMKLRPVPVPDRGALCHEATDFPSTLTLGPIVKSASRASEKISMAQDFAITLVIGVLAGGWRLRTHHGPQFLAPMGCRPV